MQGLARVGRRALVVARGNVRELKNAVERAAILADAAIDTDALPRPQQEKGLDAHATLEVHLGTPIGDVERRLILATLESLGGNKRRAAEVLGISLKTLYSRLAVYEAQDQVPPEGDPTP